MMQELEKEKEFYPSEVEDDQCSSIYFDEDFVDIDNIGEAESGKISKISLFGSEEDGIQDL
jgi:hypothetical protein